MPLYDFTSRGIPSVALRCLGFQQLTVGAGAVALTVPANTLYAFMQLDTQPIRVRLDGTAPTAAIGQAFVAGDVFFIAGSDLLNKFQAIRSGGADGVLNIHYFAQG